jgi:hypothetical protein
MSDFTFKGTYTDFIQRVMRLDGDPWTFEHRPYIYPIINTNTTRTLMMTARQVEKSTTVSGIILSKACLYANKSFLYVAPTFKQVGVFSRKKIDEVFETSPLLRKNFYPGVKGFRIEEKRLKNLSTFYFRSAFHDADTIRGLTAHDISFDEFQDLLESCIDVIEACALKKLDAQFRYTGTPKTMDNNIQTLWDHTSANEWHVKCLHCGYWNKLGIELVLLDKPGIWCRKCKKELEVNKGCWVSTREVDDFAGFRMPYIILHKSYIRWKELFFKIRNSDTGTLMNEVFGESYDNGQKPLSRDQLIASCSLDRPMWNMMPTSISGVELYAGIDWGGGNTGFTILTIGYFDTIANKFKIIFAKRYIGREAEPENLVFSITKTLMDFHVSFVGADFGFGFDLNSRMRGLLPKHVVYVTYRHSIIKKALAWDDQGNTYVTNRTEVMTDLFNAIKSKKVEPYQWSEFEDIGKDYCNINSEYSDRLRQMRYIHTQPDDAFHSLLYSRLTWMKRTDQIISTRLDPGDSDVSVNLSEND